MAFASLPGSSPLPNLPRVRPGFCFLDLLAQVLETHRLRIHWMPLRILSIASSMADIFLRTFSVSHHDCAPSLCLTDKTLDTIDPRTRKPAIFYFQTHRYVWFALSVSLSSFNWLLFTQGKSHRGVRRNSTGSLSREPHMQRCLYSPGPCRAWERLGAWEFVVSSSLFKVHSSMPFLRTCMLLMQYAWIDLRWSQLSLPRSQSHVG